MSLLLGVFMHTKNLNKLAVTVELVNPHLYIPGGKSFSSKKKKKKTLTFDLLLILLQNLTFALGAFVFCSQSLYYLKSRFYMYSSY